MSVKQINIYKDKQDRITGVTIFHWGDQLPSIITYDPPGCVRIKFEKTKPVKKKRKKDT